MKRNVSSFAFPFMHCCSCCSFIKRSRLQPLCIRTTQHISTLHSTQFSEALRGMKIKMRRRKQQEKNVSMFVNETYKETQTDVKWWMKNKGSEKTTYIMKFTACNKGARVRWRWSEFIGIFVNENEQNLWMECTAKGDEVCLCCLCEWKRNNKWVSEWMKRVLCSKLKDKA